MLDGGQPAERGLSAASVVGAFDSGGDRDSQAAAGGPALPAEDVVLQEREDRSHGGVVTGGADVAHRADHAVTGEGSLEFPRPELAASVAVQDAAGEVTAPASDR